MYSLINYERFKYKDYVYPWWGELLGWLMALSSMLIIPIYAVYKIFTTDGTIKEVILLFYHSLINLTIIIYLLIFEKIKLDCNARFEHN